MRAGPFWKFVCQGERICVTSLLGLRRNGAVRIGVEGHAGVFHGFEDVQRLPNFGGIVGFEVRLRVIAVLAVDWLVVFEGGESHLQLVDRVFHFATWVVRTQRRPKQRGHLTLIWVREIYSVVWPFPLHREQRAQPSATDKPDPRTSCVLAAAL